MDYVKGSAPTGALDPILDVPVLGFALEQTGGDLPNVSYAAFYPVAVIAKTILAQLFLAL